MANNFFFFLLFCTTILFTSPLFAENDLEKHTSSSTQLDLCDMPPPDSGRITVTGYNFISMEWTPVWVGATHTLVTLYQANDSSSWVPVDTFLNVVGSSFTYENLQFASDKYGFLISTNCPGGEPGTEFNFISPPISVILELTIGGVTPVNPMLMPECTPMKIGSSSWLGFYISGAKGLSSPNNYFEVTWNGGYAIVKRVLYSPVVAGTGEYDYPQLPPNDKIKFYYGNPKSVSFHTFKINGEDVFTDIGPIRIIHTSDGVDQYFTFCKAQPTTWNSEYILRSVMASTNGEGTTYSSSRDSKEFLQTYGENPLIHLNDSKNIRVQNPFQNSLNIYLPSLPIPNGQCSIRMWDINGRLVLENFIDLEDKNITIPTTFLPAGTYFLRITTDSYAETVKILKTE